MWFFSSLVEHTFLLNLAVEALFSMDFIGVQPFGLPRPHWIKRNYFWPRLKYFMWLMHISNKKRATKTWITHICHSMQCIWANAVVFSTTAHSQFSSFSSASFHETLRNLILSRSPIPAKSDWNQPVDVEESWWAYNLTPSCGFTTSVIC